MNMTSNKFVFNTDNQNFDRDFLRGLSVYDDYNIRCDVISLLVSHGWNIENELPSKLQISNGNNKGYIYSDKTFIVENKTEMFNENVCYTPFHIFAALECSGDHHDATIRLKAEGFGVYENDRKSKTEKLIDNSNVSYLDEKGKLNPTKLCEFLNSNNIIRISKAGEDSLSIFKIDKKIIRDFNYKTDTLSFLTERIKGQSKDEISNLIYGQRNAIIDIFKLMPGVEYNFQKDTKNVVFIPFKNGVLKVSQNCEPIMINYDSELINYFAETETQKHEFVLSDFNCRQPGNFEKFLTYAVVGRETNYEGLSERERCDLRAFYSMIGYLISNYKNPAKTPAIIFSDAGADDESRRGRRGKTILTKAISLFKKIIIRGGGEFDPTYRHNFATLTQLHNLFVIDDVPASFNYNALYTQIAGDISSEKKGSHAVDIPFRDAPKFIITTNWAVRYDKAADSTNDRFKEYKFSYFWNVNNKPDNYFNELFFDDWNCDEWQRFFEFMVICTWEFLTNGLQEIKYDKEDDNFRAYFSNDSILHEFERIIPAMQLKIDTQGYFTSSEFLEIHTEKFRFKPLFNHINIKNYILSYSDKYGLNLYQNNRRQWTIDNNK